MREIKFRAWADQTMYQNVGVVRNLVILDCEYSEQIGEIHLEPTYYGLNDDSIVLMQFTGLTDSNEVEIYEGDILEDFISKQRYEVMWDDYGIWLFNPVGTEGQAIDYYEFEDQTTSATIVIGNIYEHPQLKK